MQQFIENISEEQAIQVLEAAGHGVQSAVRIQEGSNHFVFDTVLKGGKPAICKFARVRDTEQGHRGINTDSLFGGPLSIGRERDIFTTVRETAGLPAPRIYDAGKSEFGEYLLLEKMPGISQKAFLVNGGYTLKDFLASMNCLGQDFAQLHNSVRPQAFGDYIGPNNIQPSCDNFADRWMHITDMRVQRALVKGMLTDAQAATVLDFFAVRFNSIRESLHIAETPAVLVFTDMHGENFFVDENGKPSGYFDLESAQAAPAALEFYGFRFFLFNFYGEYCYHKGQEAFFDGYAAKNGPFPPKTNADNELIDLLTACRMLEISQSYWGYIDGIRDKWGEKVLGELYRYMETGRVDYIALGEIWRGRDGQPREAVR